MGGEKQPQSRGNECVHVSLRHGERVRHPDTQHKQNGKCPRKIQGQRLTLVPQKHQYQKQDREHDFQRQLLGCVGLVIHPFMTRYAVDLPMEEKGDDGMANRPSAGVKMVCGRGWLGRAKMKRPTNSRQGDNGRRERRYTA